MGPHGQPDGSGDRFGLLLLVLIASYLLSAFLASYWTTPIQIVLFVVVATLAIRTGHLRRRTGLRWIIAAAAGSVIAFALALTHTDAGTALASLWAGLVLLFTVVLIVRRILGHPVITLQSIFGAVSAYLILGLMFAAFYTAMNRLGGGGFFAHGKPATATTFQYFSFTTLTTLGYGDFTAARSTGQAVAVMEAVVGQVFLATLVARLVAAFRPRSTGTRRGRSQRKPGTARRGPAQRPARPRRLPGAVRRASPRDR